MFTAKEINRIEDYIYGRLDKESATAFVEEMVGNAALLQEVFVRQLVQESAEEQHLVNLLEEAHQDANMEGFVSNIQAIDESFHVNIQQLLEEKDKPESNSEPTTYTLDELLAMFRPAAEYEEVLLSAARAADMEVLKPQNGADCTNGQIEFVLKQNLSADFKVRIENNRMEAILSKRFKAKETRFVMELPSHQFPPGRYYWKLWNKSGLVMGMFFVGKELMPNG